MSLVSEYLTKDTAVSQKCQQNISKSLNAMNTSCPWQQLPISVHILPGEDYLLAHYRKFFAPQNCFNTFNTDFNFSKLLL